jgi:PAS domain S-box-containing protein/diguanylate cyclase (GGDEF)-like protein
VLEQWKVLLEVAPAAADRVRREDVAQLLDALDPTGDGGSLYSPSRYALQVTTTGSDPVDALARVLSAWGAAVSARGFSAATVLRTEVMTPEEFERDYNDFQPDWWAGWGPVLRGAQGAQANIGEDLLRRAFSDSLTGLVGAEAFLLRLETALVGERGEQIPAVVSVGLEGRTDGAHKLGDTTRDRLVVDVAQRITARLRPGDSLARMADDEFAVMLAVATDEEIEAVGARLLEVVREPVTIDGNRITVTGAVGMACSEADDAALSVVAKAQSALQMAREASGSGPVLFPRSMAHPAPLRPHRESFADHDPLARVLLLLEAAVTANRADTLEEAASAVMRQICSHLGCAIGHVAIPPSPDSNAMKHLWHVSGSADYAGFRRSSERAARISGTGICGRVASSGQALCIPELAADGDRLLAADAVAAGLESAVAFPVPLAGEIVAVLEFFSRTRTELNSSALEVLAGVGIQLSRVVERQRAATALVRSEEMLRQAQHMAGIGTWNFDLRTGQTAWSQEMCSLYGLDSGESPPDFEAALQRVHSADADRALAALSRLMAGEPTAEEIRIVRQDGTVRWHRVQCSVITDDQGRVTAIHGTSQDISERKAVEEMLQRRERELGAAQSVAQFGWWERDLSTGDVIWSDELYRMWGWEPGRPVTLAAFLASVHADDRQHVLEELRRLDPGEAPISLDYRAVVAGGQLRWFRARKQLLVDAEGTPVTVFGTTQDVTDEKRAEKDLRAAKEAYQRIIETAHEGIITVDAQGFTTFANGRMAEILGYDADEMVGMPSPAFVDPETQAALADHRDRRRAGISEHYETDLQAKDGSVVRVLVSASPLIDEDGEFAGALAMVTDVSALGEAEEVLRLHRLGHDATAQAPRPGPAVS